MKKLNLILIVITSMLLISLSYSDVVLEQPNKPYIPIGDMIKIRTMPGVDVRMLPEGVVIGIVVYNYKDSNLNKTIIETGSKAYGTYVWDRNYNHHYVKIYWSKITSPVGKVLNVTGKLSDTVKLNGYILEPNTEANFIVTKNIFY